ncbi:MAG: TolC family protein [Saprospiraceae bacterium]|nr:TolC family protein [Saprospiraceae bacterium]
MLVNVHKLKFVVLLLMAVVLVGQGKAQVWTLQQCVDTAQVYNKSLAIGRNNVEIGKQRQKEARANFLPKIDVNAGYKYYTDLPYQLMPMSVFGGADGEFRETQFGVPHNINTTLQFALPLYNPQINGAVETTKIASESKDLQYKKAEEEVYFEIANLYFNAQILGNQMVFIDSNLINSKRLLATIKLLREQLLAKGTDVDKVLLQHEQLAVQRQSVNSKYEQVLNALKFVMGVSVDQTIEVEQGIEYRDKSEYAHQSTIDIQLAKTQQRLLFSERSTLKNSRLPSVSLFGTYGFTGFGYDQQPNEFLTFYPIGFVGLQIDYPLFNGTITKRKIAQKDLELTNSALQLDLLTRQNHMQIENVLLQRSVAQHAVEINTSQIQLAQSVYEQTVFQQSEGVATITDILLADNALREAQQNYLTAIIDYLKADLELKKLTGNILNK